VRSIARFCLRAAQRRSAIKLAPLDEQPGPKLKTYQIELQRVKAMKNGNGLVEAQVDALILARSASDGGAQTTLLSMDEDTARVLFLLLKAQLAEVDKRKGRSQR
jgi:hypothetical protein